MDSETGMQCLRRGDMGGLKEGQIVNRLAEEYQKDHKEEITDETIL